jgi:ligand-binding SRPBCC domain-containing protein
MSTTSNGLIFNAALYVDEPPPVVWEYFTDLRQWNRWSPICRQCSLLGDRIENGNTLQITFKVIGITVTVNAELVDVMAPNLITWRGTRFGINALHTYRFSPHTSGTLMTNEEKISGAVFPLSVLIKSWYRITNLSRKSLEGIRGGISVQRGLTTRFQDLQDEDHDQEEDLNRQLSL